MGGRISFTCSETGRFHDYRTTVIEGGQRGGDRGTIDDDLHCSHCREVEGGKVQHKGVAMKATAITVSVATNIACITDVDDCDV